MTDYQELCEKAAGCALPGERLEIFARRVATAAVRIGPDGGRRTDTADGWVVCARSSADGSSGQAVGDMPDESGLSTLLAAARHTRETAPRAMAPGPGTERFAPGPAEPGAAEDMPRPPRAAAEAAAREAAGQGPASVTASVTYRTVLRYDSAGWRGGYRQSESQLHVRSARPGLDAAQGARIRRSARELPVGAVVADLERSLAALGAPRRKPARIDRVWLSPLVAARIIQRLARAFTRVPGRRHPWETGQVIADGHQRLILVDDIGFLDGAATALFDDEGVPRRRTVLLDRGHVAGLLGSLAAGPTTGSAHWAGWGSDPLPAVAACRAEPTADRHVPSGTDLDGRVLLAEELRGFRGGLDLAAGRIECELTGAVLEDGQRAGSTRVGISASAADFLGAVQLVLSGTEFYRVQGMYGGSWWSLDGKVITNDDQ